MSGSILYWTQNYGSPDVQKKTMDDLVAAYKKESGVEVKYEIINWSDASTKWNLAFQTGDMPDVADLFWLQSRVVAGGGKWGPLNLDDEVKAGTFGDVNRFYPLAIEESKYEGSWYAIPWRFDTRILTYRTDIFTAAGLTPPTTTDEVIDVAKKLTTSDGNQYGVALASSGGSATSYHHLWMWLMQIWGVPMLTSDFKRAAFNTPEAREALQWAADLTNKYKVTPPNVVTPGFSSETEFMAGRVAMTFPQTATFPLTQREAAPQLDGKYAGALVPKAKVQAALGFSAPVVVFENTKNREAAIDWLRYFTSTEAQSKVCTAFLLANSSREVMADPFYQSNEWWKTIGEQAQYAQMTDMPTPAWNEISADPGGPMYDMMNEVLFGGSVDEIITRYETKFNDILKKYD